MVLRTIKYNDKNAIVRVYTDMHGVMAFLLPQGSGKVARQRRALFQPLSLVEIVADIRHGRDLYSIKEARCLHPLHSLHTDPVKNAVALFVTELLSAVIVEQERNPALFSFCGRWCFSTGQMTALPISTSASFIIWVCLSGSSPTATRIVQDACLIWRAASFPAAVLCMGIMSKEWRRRRSIGFRASRMPTCTCSASTAGSATGCCS